MYGAVAAAYTLMRLAQSSDRHWFVASTVRHFSIARSKKHVRYNRHTFVDRVRLQVSGGAGGLGCSSFSRTHRGVGAPDGGDGGSGGDVIIRASANASYGLTFPHSHFKAGRGANGGSEHQSGARGSDAVVEVPLGTIVRRLTRRRDENGNIGTIDLADLVSDGQQVCVVKGGRGGYGNRAFTTSYRSANRFSTVGEVGQSDWIQLQLKTVADCGLVGWPNAGKSSLLDAISRARPKIANYPFTTMAPQVGVVEVNANHDTSKLNDKHDDHALFATDMSTFTMADLPGLVEDAHENVGLGHAFLSHLQRCHVLVLVVDCGGNDGRDPVDDYKVLRHEMAMFDPALSSRPFTVFANKCDGASTAALDNVSRLQALLDSECAAGIIPMKSVEVISGSCIDRIGLNRVVERVNQLIMSSRMKQRRAVDDEIKAAKSQNMLH